MGSLFPGVYFHPRNLLFSLEGFFYSGIDDFDHHRRDISTYTITLDIGNDRIVGYFKTKVLVSGNRIALGGHFYMLITHNSLNIGVYRRFREENYILEKVLGKTVSGEIKHDQTLNYVMAHITL